ncbi:MAG: N-(5'-phosphoribosyl)anthranilate isomerase [Desulfotomaculum sp. 46_296]|nr:MAG: N-(5'-phosphoribosyl)anthranilate isomerase [Desulfotomaculum sp. 46_296]HAU32022.1 N-(5'-phosphoribosyl)anthranilate isomerase [Desulfotomaculum sp.]
MTRVKICGLMNEEDVNLCVKAGAHTVGFVVDYPVPVPWNLTKAEAGRLIEKVPPYVSSCVVTGGTVENILAAAEAVRPDLVQLHYQEILQEIKELSHRLSRQGIKTIKALRIDSHGKCAFEITDPVIAARALAETEISALLVDSYTDFRPGGTGVTVDLSAFKAVQQEVALPVILAGGLNPANVLQIIHEADPYAVDVLTGVEDEFGNKDPDKVYQFMRIIKESELNNRP